MIQQYLNAQLISTSEDTNIDKLQNSSVQIAGLLKEKKAKILKYTLASLDPFIDADNPEITEAKGVIIENWRTFVTSSSDTALTIIRSVILEALSQISVEDQYAEIIWFSGRDVIRYFKLGREKDILVNFLLQLGNRIQKEATREWSFGPDRKLKVPEIENALISKAELEVQFKAASLHKDWGGENTSTTATNDKNWSTLFSTRVSKGIQDVFNKAFRKQALSFKTSQETFLYDSLLIQMRTHLLWWKEANYSDLLNNSYATVAESILPIVLAKDISNFIPYTYPVSVDYFLKEVHNKLSSQGNSKKTILEIITAVKQNASSIIEYVNDDVDYSSRISLLVFIIGLIKGDVEISDFKKLVGIDETANLTLAELTVWLFHDVTVSKLINKN
jgi:hypothetical protein